jgi:hypothetical protein
MVVSHDEIIRDAGAEDRMTQTQAPGKLERRARALLLAYPAEYRHGRAEEIIGTLLEAAPPGRSYPPTREAWSLMAGGRHARAARNHRPGVKTNLRLALLLGMSIYLSIGIGFPVVVDLLGFADGGARWLTIATGVLGTAAVLAPWLGSRAATTALAIPAGALVAYWGLKQNEPSIPTMVWLAALLIVMAALAAASGGPVRLPRSWLWLPCATPATLLAGSLLLHARGLVMETYLSSGARWLLVFVVVCWLVTDARPALGLCVAQLLGVLPDLLSQLAVPGSPNLAMVIALLLQLALVLPVLLPAAWLLLRRQKAPNPRPFREP